VNCVKISNTIAKTTPEKAGRHATGENKPKGQTSKEFKLKRRLNAKPGISIKQELQ